MRFINMYHIHRAKSPLPQLLHNRVLVNSLLAQVILTSHKVVTHGHLMVQPLVDLPLQDLNDIIFLVTLIEARHRRHHSKLHLTSSHFPVSLKLN